MKKLFFLILLLGLLTSCVACTGTRQANVTGKADHKSLKILFIGHSTVQDEVTYAPFILDRIAPELDLTMGIAYRSSTNISGADGFNAIFGNPTKKLSIYSVYEPHASAWINSERNTVTVKEALDGKEWDVVVVCESALYNKIEGMPSLNTTHYAVMGEFIDKIVNYIKRPLKFGVYFHHNRYCSNDYKNVLEKQTTYNEIIKQYKEYVWDVMPVQFFFPGITAYWNARGTVLDGYGNAPHHHMLADYGHYQEGIGCLVGGYTTALKILEIAGIHDKSVLGDKTRPDLQWVIDRKIPGKNPGKGTTVVGISDENCLIAQKCAVMAVKNPTKITIISQNGFPKNE